MVITSMLKAVTLVRMSVLLIEPSEVKKLPIATVKKIVLIFLTQISRRDHLGVETSPANLIATANNVNQVALRAKILREKRTLNLGNELMKAKHELKNIAKEQARDAAAT
nr:hypothetical protein Iba_scaffold5116CG0010 [Ipomoea batatas]